MIDTSKYTREELLEMRYQRQRELEALHFGTSAMTEAKIDKKRNRLYHSFDNLFNENLNLRKFIKKDKAKSLTVVYQIADLNEDEKHGIKRFSWVTYDKKRKDIYTYPLLNKEEYHKFVTGSDAEALQVLCKKTLDGIAPLKKYEKRLNFDWQGLNNEFKLLFKKEFQYEA